MADHSGTRVDVTIKVDCRDGYHFEDTWSDYNFKVEANSEIPDLYLAIYVP